MTEIAIPPVYHRERPARALCIAAKNHSQQTLELIFKHFPDASQYLITPISLNNHPPQLPLYYALQSFEVLNKKPCEPLSYYYFQKHSAYKFVNMLSEATLALLPHESENYVEIKAGLRRAFANFQRGSKENSSMHDNLSFRTLLFSERTTETRQDTTDAPVTNNGNRTRLNSV